jgi:uncharacterized SAM-binding protein YcdF (DUF218 family)
MIWRISKGVSRVFRSVGRVSRFLLAAYGLSLLLIFYSPVADYLVSPLWISPDRTPAPAIVLLTAWVSPDGVLNEQAMRRTHAAARLYREGLAPRVIISGGDPAAGSEPQAADFMAEFATELGIPRSAILLEKKSENTHSSAVFVSAICRDLGIQRVLLVTDAVHMRRAMAAFRAQHLSVSPVSADPWSLGWESPMIRLHKFMAAVHEYGGLLYYRWNGWI